MNYKPRQIGRSHIYLHCPPRRVGCSRFQILILRPSRLKLADTSSFHAYPAAAEVAKNIMAMNIAMLPLH